MLVDADNGSVDHLDGAIMSFGEGLHDQVRDASRWVFHLASAESLDFVLEMPIDGDHLTGDPTGSV